MMFYDSGRGNDLLIAWQITVAKLKVNEKCPRPCGINS